MLIVLAVAGVVTTSMVSPGIAASIGQQFKVQPTKYHCNWHGMRNRCAASSFAKPGDACTCTDTNGITHAGVVH
jgi:hypothetical protein